MILESRHLSRLNSLCFLVGQIRLKNERQMMVVYHLISLGEKLLMNLCELKLVGLL